MTKTTAPKPSAIVTPAYEPATSNNAKSAKALVERYYALIDKKKYKAARLLWDDDGAASGGNDAAFAATFAPYSVYRATVGAPTPIATVDGRQFIKVAAELQVKRRSNGAQAHRTGVVMLRRSADPKEKVVAKRQWRIWGIDLRVQD